MATLDPKTIDMFHFTGSYQSTPNCPVELIPNFNPSSAAPTFQESDSVCSKPPVYTIPFFMQRPGPKNEEWTINAHEARPGHYTQVGYVNKRNIPRFLSFPLCSPNFIEEINFVSCTTETYLVFLALISRLYL